MFRQSGNAFCDRRLRYPAPCGVPPYAPAQLSPFGVDTLLSGQNARNSPGLAKPLSTGLRKQIHFAATGPLTGRLGPRKRTAVAQVAELVDAPASGAGACKGVEVRVLSWAPLFFLSRKKS
jgi:hypothetical protein